MNTIGGPVKDKLEFIKDYKFVLAFENVSYPGYTTEKLLEPLIVNSIPVYWGNPLVGNDFNKECFINYDDFPDEKAVISQMVYLESNPEKAIDLIMRPKFPANELPEAIRDENVIAFLEGIINSRFSIKPVARTGKKNLHSMIRKKRFAAHYLRRVLRLNVR